MWHQHSGDRLVIWPHSPSDQKAASPSHSPGGHQRIPAVVCFLSFLLARRASVALFFPSEGIRSEFFGETRNIGKDDALSEQGVMGFSFLLVEESRLIFGLNLWGNAKRIQPIYVAVPRKPSMKSMGVKTGWIRPTAKRKNAFLRYVGFENALNCSS